MDRDKRVDLFVLRAPRDAESIRSVHALGAFFLGGEKLMRTSTNKYIGGRLVNGFDYENQFWVLDGIIRDCGHPREMDCGCKGRKMAGQQR